MNLLIIDDEKYVIESIRQNVDWEKTGIDHVYSATLVRQAEHIMENIPIEIVLCDIVMPQCTGLELIEHFREQGYEMQVIFLTSYARFEYAQKAITLDSVDYLLKPVDFNLLTETLRKARDKAESIQGFRQYQKKQDDHTEHSMDRIKKYIRDSGSIRRNRTIIRSIPWIGSRSISMSIFRKIYEERIWRNWYI